MSARATELAAVLAAALLLTTGPVAAMEPGTTGPTESSERVRLPDDDARRESGTDEPTVDGQSSNVTREEGNSTIFRRVEAERSSFVVEVNVSMLTSLFREGSTFRLVTGGTAAGSRVVWFDVGIGYAGGPVLSDPLDNFVVRSEMWMNFPGL